MSTTVTGLIITLTIDFLDELNKLTNIFSKNPLGEFIARRDTSKTMSPINISMSAFSIINNHVPILGSSNSAANKDMI